jgi:hypothetical protein
MLGGMRRKTSPARASEPGTALIIEVEGYEGEDGSIVVWNDRAARSGLGVSDRIYCIGEMAADGVIRFNDWGYATAAEARAALDGRRHANAPASSPSPAPSAAYRAP